LAGAIQLLLELVPEWHWGGRFRDWEFVASGPPARSSR
jgi:hypothetical protein